MSNKSKYAQKFDKGERMYGPGCCAHKVSDAQIAAAKERARKAGHFERIDARQHYVTLRDLGMI